MKTFFIIFLYIFVLSCSKPKTVLICGDRECINNSEAEQYFEKNLTIEVKVIDKKKKEIDLIELNLNKNSSNKKRIVTAKKKDEINEEFRVFNKKKIKKMKDEIKISKKRDKSTVGKISNKNEKNTEKNIIINKNQKIKEEKKNVTAQEIVDVCTLIKKCSIDEISKFLIKEGIGKKFPDLTLRQKSKNL